MKPEGEKKKIPVAETTGFMTKDGERRFVMDQNRQLDLQTMEWFPQDTAVKDLLKQNFKASR